MMQCSMTACKGGQRKNILETQISEKKKTTKPHLFFIEQDYRFDAFEILWLLIFHCDSYF